MATMNLAGILRVDDTTYITELPRTDVTDAINAIVARYQAERNEATNLFVAETTTNRVEKVRSGSVDMGQELGPDGRPLETRPVGEFEVGYVWKRIGWAFGGNSETQARMTVADTQRSVSAITAGNARRHMVEINRAFFNNANLTDEDEFGTITVRRLANQDGTMYAPLINTDEEAEDNHYLASGYAASGISDTNNPFVTLAAEIREHLDASETIVAFINSAQRSQVLTGLSDFVDADIEGITRGATADRAQEIAGRTVPGEFLGVDGASGVYVYVWDRTPAGYINAMAVTAPAPLKMRIPDLAALQGFRLEAEEEHDPFWKRTYRERFGYGAANRLNAAVMQLTTGSYTVPAIYA